MLDKLSEQELEGFIDLYENLVPRTKQQKFQSRLIATIVDLKKQLDKAPKRGKAKVYKEALEKIIEKYSSKNGAVKIAEEALK